MPWVTLNRNYTLSSTTGFIAEFRKGERRFIPPRLLPEALAIGAIPEEDPDVLPPEQEAVALPSGAAREKLFFDAFEKVMLRNARGDFSASGLPNAKRISEIVGFEVDNKERDAMWLKFNAMKADEEAQK